MSNLKKTSLLLTLLLNIVLFNSAFAANWVGSSEALNKEKRNISDFNSVNISGAGNLYIKQGSREELSVEAERNILADIKTEVKDKVLYLGSNDNTANAYITTEKPINYYLTVKNLQNIDTNGAVHLIAKDTLSQDELTLAVHGASNIDLKVKVKKLFITTDGSGSMIIQGNAQEQEVKLNGASDYNAKKLLTKKTAVYINGAANAEVNVSDELHVEINGYGNVRFYGKPKITQETSGGGEIIPLDR